MTDLFKKLDALHINTRSKHWAIKDIKEKDWAPSRVREILMDLSGKSADKVTDTEAEKTLMYLVGQILDPFANVSLDDAQLSALLLFEKYPHILAEQNPDLDSEGNLIVKIETNEDGVELGNNGKVRKGYKKEMALELWRTNPKGLKRTDRKSWAALFVEKISEMNSGTASAYLGKLERGEWV